MMLKPGDDDLVVLLNVAPSPTLRNQVDGLGGSRTNTISRAAPALRKRRVFSRADS